VVSFKRVPNVLPAMVFFSIVNKNTISD